MVKEKEKNQEVGTETQEWYKELKQNNEEN